MAADSSSDLTNVAVQFHNCNLQHDKRNPTDCSVYLGEILRYEIVITKPKEADFKGWKRRVAQLSAHACVSPIESKSGANNIGDKQVAVENEGSPKGKDHEKSRPETESVVCAVIATYIDTLEKKPHVESGSFKGTSEKHFKDGNTCIIPMLTCVWNTPGQCQRAQLTVSLWLSASPQNINPDLEAKRDFHLTSGTSLTTSATASRKCVQQMSVTKTVHVQDPPHLKVRFVSCGQQHLLSVQVKNASCQTITVKNLTIVPSSSPSCDHREFFRDSLPFRDSNRIRSESTQPLVSLALSGGSVFPVILSGCEEMALIYRLDLSSISSEVELAFHSYLRWTHAETCKEINTVFRLPKLRVRYPAFTVTVKCEGPVETGKTFYLTYNIANNLQDFLSVRLYWNLDSQLSLLRNKDPVPEDAVFQSVWDFRSCSQDSMSLGS
ncbi:trafficking protein particle complex subunit 14-like [Babylonia areolata]|uniref:trafficking protein particle complex subunit 14-like n=1 Tax=Babylonia areolata TaxID=304850 RepID=UPI003FD6B4BC